MNVEIGAEAAQFPEKEYINGIAFAVCENIFASAIPSSKAGKKKMIQPFVWGAKQHPNNDQNLHQKSLSHWDRFTRVAADRENWNWGERRR